MSRACLVSWLLFLLILKLGSLNVHLGFVVGCHEAEREALLKFRQSLNDTKNLLSSWEGKDCCHWEGVGCDNVTFYVNLLDVHDPYYDPYDYGEPSSIISSKLDRSLVELSRLKYLELSGIDFQISPIPGFIGSFKHLRYLNLSYSYFSGVVPSQLGNLTRLHTLDLSSWYDTLSSDVHWVSSLVSLRYLNMNNVRIYRSMKSTHMINMPPLLGLQLSHCQLTVPSLISLFSNFTWPSLIQQLDLSYNSFTGSLPGVFINMTSLRYLDLSGMKFNGSIPLWLKNMRKLEHLDLSRNHLEGPLPHVFANMTSLTYLSLSFNSFNGSIPLWIQNMGKLQNLDLSNNNFSQGEGGATIMGILGNMCKLKSFDLSYNLIGGEIGAHLNLSKCATYDLEYLELGGNMIGGTLPSWLGDFKSLSFLDILDNAIEGPIPVSIGSLSYLEVLDLFSNNLTGTLPNSLGDMIKLRFLDVGNNGISGEIPTSVGKLSSLEELYLSQNSLNGTIPEGLGQCKALTMIDLSSNFLRGVVSESLFTNLSYLQSLDLSSNSLEVNLGSNWSPPFQLTMLYLRSCKMQTQFPQWIGKQTRLYELDLSDNMLSGNLDSLFRLKILEEVNISHNQLTGPVPYFSSSLILSIDLYNRICKYSSCYCVVL